MLAYIFYARLVLAHLHRHREALGKEGRASNAWRLFERRLLEWRNENVHGEIPITVVLWLLFLKPNHAHVQSTEDSGARRYAWRLLVNDLERECNASLSVCDLLPVVFEG